jgi:LysR family transcriptional activator of nhaA
VGLAISPAVVLADELSQGILSSAPFPLDIVESSYAVTASRTFPHPLLADLLPDVFPPR